MKYSFASLLTLGLATATPYAANTIRSANSTRKLIVSSGSGRINSVDFDGKKFTISGQIAMAGTNPSWTLFKEPNILYANDENSDITRLFTFDRNTNEFANITDNEGSTGVVFLEFNHDESRMLGASFTNGTVDVWDSSAPDGTIKLLNTVVLDDALGPNNLTQTTGQAHEIVRDPSGRFFAVPERGADTISILDSQHNFDVVNKIRIEPPGCGPRHGTFIKSPQNASVASHFVFVCELLNQIQLFSVEYLPTTLKFELVQSRSTFGDDIPPKNPTVSVADATKTFAAAGECIIASNQRDIYVSNRLTGNKEDSIAHFILERDPKDKMKASLQFGESISSFGLVPRMFSLSLHDESILFSTNQNNGTGLLAYNRDAQGKLSVIEESKIDIEQFRDNNQQFGPEFVQQI